MKKNMLAILTILIAIGLSAFTTAKKEQSQTAQPALFWYTVDNLGKLSGPVNSSAADKTTQMQFTPCDDTSQTNCLLGTDSNDDHGQPISIVPAGDEYRIREIQ